MPRSTSMTARAARVVPVPPISWMGIDSAESAWTDTPLSSNPVGNSTRSLAIPLDPVLDEAAGRLLRVTRLGKLNCPIRYSPNFLLFVHFACRREKVEQHGFDEGQAAHELG